MNARDVHNHNYVERAVWCGISLWSDQACLSDGATSKNVIDAVILDVAVPYITT